MFELSHTDTEQGGGAVGVAAALPQPAAPKSKGPRPPGAAPSGPVVRIGLDLDGVLAQFIPAYRTLLWQLQPGEPPTVTGDPREWHFEGGEGFTSETVRRAWDRIIRFPTWWEFLAPYPDARIFIRSLARLPVAPVFVTTRPQDEHGETQAVTERWVHRHLGVTWPVVITDDKAREAQALGLSALVDDRPENLASLPEGCLRILLARGWNKTANVTAALRAADLANVLDILESRIFGGAK